MKMTNKIGLMAGLLAGTMTLSGCISPQEAEQNRKYAAEYGARVARGEIKENQFNNFMDGMANAFFSGGGLFYAAGNSAAQQGNFQRANAYNTLGRMQEQNYNRETQLQAAEAGRSQVNVYVQQPAKVKNIPSLGRTPYSFAFIDWKDLNGDKLVSYDEFEGISDSYALSNIEQLTVVTIPGKIYDGGYPRVWIIDRFGNAIYNQTGGKIMHNVATVKLSAENLRNRLSEPDSWYDVRFEILDSNQQRIGKGVTVDEYQLKFIK